MKDKATIFVVDDDKAVRKSLTRSLSHNGYDIAEYDRGDAFLDDIDADQFGCVLLDVSMPGISGIQVQAILAERACNIPIIFMTGHGDVPTSVRAIKNGALEFLEKPYSMDVLLTCIEEALAMERLRRSDLAAASDIQQRFKGLSKRESEVMASLVAGLADKSNKEVARELGISYRTVEEYRSRVMQKMQAQSITHLVQMAKVCGIYEQAN